MVSVSVYVFIVINMSVWIYTNDGNHELPTLLGTTYVSGYSYYYRATVGTNEVVFDLKDSNGQWHNSNAYSSYAFAYYISSNKFVDYHGSTDPVQAVQEGTSTYDTASYTGNLELKDSSGTVVYKFVKPLYASWLNNGALPPSGGQSGGNSGNQPSQPSSSKKVFHNFW